MSVIKSFSVGDGDMFYIKHGVGSFTIIDCCLSDDNKDSIVEEIKFEKKNKSITRFISTHPDKDHLMGLDYLDDEIEILNFYCVKNNAIKIDITPDFKPAFERYCKLRDSGKKAFYVERGCERKWLNDGDQHAGLHVLWPVASNNEYREELEKANNGESFNNISIILEYNLNNGVNILWMGDLEADFMESIMDEIKFDPIDILFAPHHGRDKVPEKWLSGMDPKIVVIGEAPSENLNYYEGYNTITQNSAGDITFECVTSKVHVYVSNEEYSVDFLDNESMSSFPNYIGTLNL